MSARLLRAIAPAACAAVLFGMLATSSPARAEGRRAPSQPLLVYASMALSQTTGITNVYQVGAGGATLVATLGRGGGGPVAVDAHQNVYVVQADYDSNLFIENSRVFVYARGASKPSHDLYVKGFDILAMTAASDGSLYIAGEDYPNTNVFAVMKFAPGSRTAETLPSDPRNPIYPTGLTLDASGNLFAGWLNGSGRCAVNNLNGCVDELAAGQSAWRVDLPAPSAANGIQGGPAARGDGSLVLLAEGLDFTYLETVPPHHRLPSHVVSLSVLQCCAGGVSLLFDGTGDRVWGFQTGLGSSSTVYGLAYPSGAVSMSIPVTAPGSQPNIPTGMAVSPAYFASSGLRR